MDDMLNSVPDNASSESALSDKKIQSELVRTLYKQGHTALLGVITTSIGISVLYYNVIASEIIFSWLFVIFLLSFIRHRSMKKFKQIESSYEDVINWGWRFSFFTFLSGITWGIASLLFFTPENMQLFNVLTLIIIAMSIGSLAALSAFPWAYYLYVIPAMVPMGWLYINNENQSYRIFGVLLGVLIFALFSFVRVNNRMLRESVVLRFKNVNLISQLTQQKEIAEQANISKTQFLASASHDLRQPLHAMSLFLGVLEDKNQNSEQIMVIDKIKKSSLALENLLESLLDISKLDAKIIVINEAPFELQNLFNILKNEFKPMAQEKNLNIRFVPTSLWVNTDKQAIERILRNLIANAIKYTNEGRILIGCRRTADSVYISVYDTGIGIENDQTQIIFEEFRQVNNSGRDRSKGLGLGLSIVTRLVDILNAQLLLHSNYGHGSKFSIKLSRCLERQNASEKQAVLQIQDALTGKVIVIVEDEEDIRQALNMLLSSWGCKVYELSSPDDVSFKRLTENKPDMILADYRLQNHHTGVDAINAIHHLYQDNLIPAVIITGDTAPDRIKEAKQSGYQLMHKPISGGKLRATLNALLLEK